MGVILSQVLHQPGDPGVHLCAAQFSIVSDFTGRGPEQRGAGQVGLAITLHADHVIAHPGHVGTTRR